MKIDFLQRIIKQYSLQNSVVVVAVSGGVDSVVLLDLLIKNLPHKNLVVAHINHGLRQESAKEALVVKKIADSYGLPLYVFNLKLAKRDEATARKARYKALQKLSAEVDAKYIITAHHLNDQAETMLLKMVRGTGPTEVWGMKELEGNIRPLLTLPKADIVKYAKNNKLTFVSDRSNKNNRYARNRIRNKVLPELEKINPNYLKSFARLIDLGQEASSFLNDEVSKVQKKIVRDTSIDLKAAKKTHPYLLSSTILRLFHDQLGKRADVYAKNVGNVLSLIKSSGQKETHLGGLLVQKTYQKITFNPKMTPKPRATDLTLNQKATFGDYQFYTSVKTDKAKINNVLLPLDFSDNLKIRAWRNGDKIKTKSGTKKPQDIFVDAKIDQGLRRNWPVLIRGQEILWVPLLSASVHAKSKGKYLIVEVKNEKRKI